ncbi:MAG TPA: aminoacyl-tRNA hydrolase [Dehalococcoidia bacterium]|nr:aminoacyl-tRNA hydrolase [Dehalococcoidia bacterium]
MAAKPPDWVVAGLGNPGEKYAGHRHNVGAWCIERLARRHRARLRGVKGGQGATVTIGPDRVLLFRPNSWVNISGDVIAPLLKRLRLPVERLIVVYDELDLPEGRIRIRQRGSDGGHNGLKSIIAATGSGGFGRVRIGIGRPHVDGKPSWDPEVVARHVLSNPAGASRDVLDAAVDRACEAVEAIVREGYDRAMNRYNSAEGNDDAPAPPPAPAADAALSP